MNRSAFLLYTMLSLLAAASLHPLFAQAANPSLQDLQQIISRLQDIKVYSYHTEIRAVFPDGERDTLHTSIYMDRAHKKLFKQDDQGILLFSEGWVLKTDEENKTVSIFNVRKYNEKYKDWIPDLEEIFDGGPVSAFWDSVILKQATLLFSKRERAVSSFVLTFPPSSYIREMILVYNSVEELPERIIFKTFYAESPGSEKGSTYETRCTGYKKTVPDNLFDIRRYFIIQSDKVILKQYKNYQLNAVL